MPFGYGSIPPLATMLVRSNLVAKSQSLNTRALWVWFNSTSGHHALAEVSDGILPFIQLSLVPYLTYER